jgi:hypothetical protein
MGDEDASFSGADHVVENAPKRRRMASSLDGHVLFSCFDDPEKLVEVDMGLLKSADCRLSALVRNTQPSMTLKGKEFFRAGPIMTRDMLITLIKSVALGELVLSKGVTVAEALKVFEYEGIGLSTKQSLVKQPSSGIGFCKRIDPVAISLVSLCEAIADSMLQWPRLESTMEAVGPFHFEASVAGSLPAPSSFTATATRVWIRFADRPKSMEQEDVNFAGALMNKGPRWLRAGMIAIGALHNRMSQNDPEFAKARDRTSFNRLWKELETDPLGLFFSVRTDACKASPLEQKLKKDLYRGEKFYSEMRSIILNSQEDCADRNALEYARAAVTLVENMKDTSPNCSRIFSGHCADEAGSTPERTALKRALKKRGVSIIRWMEERDPQIRPLVFPPYWRDASSSSCYGPSVLLSIENLV